MSQISISDAAARLGCKPWEVIRMIDAGVIRQVVTVDEASIAELEKQS